LGEPPEIKRLPKTHARLEPAHFVDERGDFAVGTGLARAFARPPDLHARDRHQRNHERDRE
jgi:hypothetical protein